MKYIAPLYLCVIIKLGGGENGGLGVGGGWGCIQDTCATSTWQQSPIVMERMERLGAHNYHMAKESTHVHDQVP